MQSHSMSCEVNIVLLKTRTLRCFQMAHVLSRGKILSAHNIFLNFEVKIFVKMHLVTWLFHYGSRVEL